MTTERIFGTDGVRGRAGEGWLTDAKLAALGRAAGSVFARGGGGSSAGSRPVALLGHDGRRSGPNIVNALAHGLRMSGFDAVSTGLITTPGLAHLTRLGDWAFGAMVSASHNPADDNGVKLFSGEGGKLSDETEIAIEAMLHADEAPSAECEPTPVDHELELGYLQYLLDGPAQGLALGGMSLVLDCANGGGSRIAPRVFGRLGARVNVIGAEPDGANINADCGSTHPQALRETVRSTGAALGIALDGDGDRCILVDEKSELVHGDGIMTALARHAAGRSEYKDPRIVATVMSNRGLHRALREVGVDIVEVGVGDRRVVEGLRREGLMLGGEQSGHIVFGAENHFIGDGIYTALRILRILVESGRPLSELVAPYQPYPQILLNVPVASKPDLEGLKRFCEARDRVTEELGGDARVLVRYSGTENLARVMVEGADQESIRRSAQELAELLDEEIGSTRHA